MLIGIIKEKQNNYYVHLNYNVISIIHENKNNIKYLTSDEIHNLFNTILSSKLTYKGKSNEYDIYLDEANNNRYFKNNREDFNLFFSNNGINALEYLSEKEKEDIKKFIINVGKKVFVITTTSIIIFWAIIGYKEFRCDIGDLVLKNQEISINELESLIMNSNLTNEDKILLCNENFLNLVLETAENNRNYSLQNRLKNLSVTSFDQTAYTGSRGGFYNPLNLNIIYISDYIIPNTVAYRDTLTHEFVHLLQDSNEYYYIREACAEIMSTEFYGQYNDSYTSLITRVKVLMEIIGPQPIIECNFSGDTTSFEEAIGNYLNEEEKQKLLELFSTPSADLIDKTFDLNALNSEIDRLLATMYYNKTGNNIIDDTMINLIYNESASNRIYFNTESPHYNEDFYLTSNREILDISDFNDVLAADLIKTATWYREEIDNSQDHPIHYYIPTEVDNFENLPETPNGWFNVIYNDGTLGTVTYDQENNRWGMIEHYRTVDVYEPSITRKFPEQFQNKNNNNVEILTMLDEKDKNSKSEVKLI